MEHSIMERFLWNGLDIVKYEVRKIIPQNQSDAVVIMQSHIPSDKHWCLEYRGSGHYFSTFSELETYYKHRFKKDLMEDFTIFKDKDQNSRLSCKVYSWDKDITATLPDTAFVWHRKSGNEESDAQWDSTHTGMKSIIVTTEDVQDNASFYCEVFV